MSNAVIYSRVSSTRQAERGTSLDRQEKECRQKAAEAGESVLDEAVFIERGESAKTAERTELQKMMRYVEAHKKEISTVYHYDISRLARDNEDFHMLRAYFKRLGVRCVSVTQQVEDTPAGRFVENMFAGMAQLDNEVRSEKSRGGMVDAVGEGRFVWKAAIGYANVRILDKANIEKQEPYAGHILHGFELVEQGYMQTEALAAITKNGFRKPDGTKVSISYWNRILHNPRYKGYINSFEKEHGKATKGSFEPIVSEELFDRVQAMLAKKNHRAAKYQKQREDFPLKGVVICGCKKPFRASWSKGRNKKYPLYHCNRCPKTNVAKATIEDGFLAILDENRMDEGLAAMLRIAIEENWKTAGEANEKK